MDKVRLHLGALTAVAAGFGAMNRSADAAIVYSGFVNINIPSTTQGVYVNLVTGATGTSGASVPGWDVNPWGSTALNMFSTTSQAGGFATGYVGSGSSYFNSFENAYSVGPSDTFAATGVNTIAVGTPLIFNSSGNYIGFRFYNELTGGYHYGMMQIGLAGSAFAQPRSIVQYAYEDQPGVAYIEPAPGSAGMLALGAVGLVGRRRRA